jgi:hypothetical protein
MRLREWEPVRDGSGLQWLAQITRIADSHSSTSSGHPVIGKLVRRRPNAWQ